ncbi:amidophosphoribosyltransferase [uncultured Mycobacterium sp.]|uniref:amidophosphoribosyltransferase n=1 Tax=uncultured Mycobacterium sp. TaxID=171292 RepID=UPI0035C96601
MTEVIDDVHTALTSAGGYLRNVVREQGVTCRVCAAPVKGFELCWRCRRDGRIAGLADVVAPLTYVIAGTASANLLHRYKNHPDRVVREQHSVIVKSVLSLGITLHERCIARAVGLPVSLRLVIPSLTCRPGRHPLAELADQLSVLSEAVALVPAPEAMCDRAVNAKFALQPAVRLNGRHVLIVDDVWTTGSNAQSAALALRRAGAAAVSVMVVGRWLNAGHARTAQFISARLQRPYDPGICPVSGRRCAEE